MPHVVFVALSGFRLREPEMLALGMKLPALAARAGAVGALPALGLLTLAGATSPSWSISWRDPSAVTDELISEIVQERPNLVAISALTASIGEGYRLASRLRDEGIAVVMGGLHVTACPDEATLYADAIVVGDGEPVWHDVLADAAVGRLRPRYRALAPFDLARAPRPRFDLLASRPRARYTLQTQRGCPLACEFCGASRLLGPFREKPVAVIEQELQAIRAVSDRRPIIEFADDNTLAGRRDANELLAMLSRADVRYFTECDWRIGERPEVLHRLAESGCVQVLMGFESQVHVHEGMGAKRARLNRMVDAAVRVQEAGVAVIGCFVLGADGEDYESMSHLAELLMRLPLADIQITLQTPFPGTALRRRLADEGRLLADRGWESCTLFDVTYQPDRLSVQELERGFRQVVQMVFAPDPAARRAEIRRQVWARRGMWPATEAAEGEGGQA